MSIPTYSVKGESAEEAKEKLAAVLDKLSEKPGPGHWEKKPLGLPVSACRGVTARGAIRGRGTA